MDSEQAGDSRRYAVFAPVLTAEPTLKCFTHYGPIATVEHRKRSSIVTASVSCSIRFYGPFDVVTIKNSINEMKSLQDAGKSLSCHDFPMGITVLPSTS